MERLINRRQQGDLGEASAIEWLTRQGATVFTPMGHSPDVDLLAMLGERLVRIQVKTSVCTTRTPDGHPRWSVSLATNGGNQSWSGKVKLIDPAKVDCIFVLVGDGRRWLIPTSALEATSSVTLGGPKYSELEIEPVQPISDLVYGGQNPPLESKARQGEYPSGQRTATVNRQAQAFAGSTPASPITRNAAHVPPRFQPSKYERADGKKGEAVINQKRRVTLPQSALLGAGLRDGDRVRATADGPGRIVLEKVGLPVWAEPS